MFWHVPEDTNAYSEVVRYEDMQVTHITLLILIRY